MCYETDQIPPFYGPPVTTVSAAPLTLTSADGTRFAAFLARPERPTGTGVLVLPDNRGLSRFFEAFSVRLAERGHTALAIDYFGRTAGADVHGRDDDFVRVENLMTHLRRLTRDDLYCDFDAGVDHLRAPGGGACRAVVSVGFCMGGRFAFLTAARRFGLAGAVGLYGYPDLFNGAPGPTQLAGELRAPILALFGDADEHLPAEVVAAFDRALTVAGVEHEIVGYPGAPHGFFDLQLPEFAEASADAWRRILSFLDRHGA